MARREALDSFENFPEQSLSEETLKSLSLRRRVKVNICACSGTVEIDLR